MANFKDHNKKDIILDFINKTIIPHSNLMKWIVPFHFGYFMARKVFCKAIEGPFDILVYNVGSKTT